ncbi:FAD:protein FMN transferase [Bradyrhizobium sp. STM 3561]|uniref:FAD:protein FMN transferase n=1 Tax=Bradyrhizobium sp. STM 3561 TaxID=578923 RepID=UPI00388F488A
MAVASDNIRRARPLLGTFVEIEVAATSRTEMDAAISAAFDAVAMVHRLMSFHEPESDVSRLNREASIRPTRVHTWTFEVLETALEMNRRSRGAFDVTVAPVVMGLLPSVRSGPSISRKARFVDAIELLPEQAVRFRSADVSIDLGGIAKGFAVDRATDALRCFDIASGLVNAGGDLRAFGPDPRTVHIRNPRNPSRSICRIDVADEALASTARRVDLFGETETRGPAVIDPSTDRLVDSIDGVTVRAPSCMVADALTKIVMLAGTDAGELLEHYRASALLISALGDVQITSEWHHAVHLAA